MPLSGKACAPGDARRLRQAISLWWHDCTAEELGEAQPGLTAHVLETAAINQIDPLLLQPGDLAVTRSGVHILAYLGARQWIEADPALMKVMIYSAPEELSWLDTEMHVVRWSLLQ